MFRRTFKDSRYKEGSIKVSFLLPVPESYCHIFLFMKNHDLVFSTIADLLFQILCRLQIKMVILYLICN